MIAVILCEGVDDAYILGYFLHKTQGWTHSKERKMARDFNLSPSTYPSITYYVRAEDTLIIWPVGGKDCYDAPLDFIKATSDLPDNRINTLFVVRDRDQEAETDVLTDLETCLQSSGINVNHLRNNTSRVWTYPVDNQSYSMEIVPVIIPFDKEGALETILMDAIADTGAEDAYVVQEAKQYVEKLIDSGQLSTYLQKERLRLKAKFSAVISITNPDRSTATFDTLLMSHKWESKASLQQNFAPLRKYLSQG